MDKATVVLPPPAAAQQSVYGGFWLRLGAMLIDGIILFAVNFPLLFLLAFLIGMKSAEFVTTCTGIAYYILMHGRFGATVGKMAAGIRVVKTDGQPIDYTISAMRYSPFLLFSIVGLLFFPETNAASMAGATIATIWIALLCLYFLAAAIVLLINPQKRTIHDFIAGTVVLRKRVPGLASDAVMKM